MKQLYCSVLSIGIAFTAMSQYESAFENAYRNHPYLTKGILEAVAYSNTHIRNIQANEMESCSGMPLPYGVMGVFDNGKSYFRENGKLIESLSGIAVRRQREDVSKQILAYAKAFNHVMADLTNGQVTLAHDPKYIRTVLAELSEIPTEGIVNQFALDLQTFEILRNLTNQELAQRYNFPLKTVDFNYVYGHVNASLLQTDNINLSDTGIHSTDQPALSFAPHPYTAQTNYQIKSADYGPAIWNAAPSCNYNSRSGVAVTAITIHTIQGSYAGAISWSQNCNSNVSFHYVIRSSDGQVTQMVLESIRAWHVGSENSYTIGYEHEGWVNDASWYTTAMYNASAALSRDICNSGYGINPRRTYHMAASSGINVLGACTKIKGHQHYPNQTHTDPGINWNWERYYKLINPQTTPISYTASTGNFYDAGGASANYADDDHRFWLIQPTAASSVTLNFSSFNLENNYDYLLIYNGTTTAAPLIGKYTGTTIPSSITANSGKMLIEFRSDCATNAAGWAANWTTTGGTTPSNNLYTTIPADNSWKTSNFSIPITDVATAGIQTRFYLLGMKPSGYTGWSARAPLGFVNEDFQDNRTNWTNGADTWTLTGGIIKNNSATNDNTNLYMSALQSQYSTYLYHWDQKITSTGTNQRAGLHFFCSNATGTNRGNSYFVYFRASTNKVQIYKVTNDVHTLVKEDECTVNVGTSYDVKVVYNPANGTIKVFVDDQLKSTWIDSAPLQSGTAISLRTGECITEFDNVRMYRSRATNVDVTVGALGHFNQPSVSSIRSGLARSILLSSTNQWSTEVYQQYLVDFSTAFPTNLTYELKKENGTTKLVSQFDFTDEESQIETVLVALGTKAGEADLLDWKNVTSQQTFEHSLYRELNTDIYITYSVKNHAGLEEKFSLNTSKNYQSTALPTIFPNPTNNYFAIDQIPQNTTVQIIDQMGRTIWSGVVNPLEKIAIDHFATGLYSIKIKTADMEIVRSLVKE